jgi:CRP/FNR family cyclic AMP-dependent transcriptional regulator
MDDIAVLKEVPLFSGMDDEEVIAIREIMDLGIFAPGEVIMREGEPGDNFYVVVQGNVQFSMQLADGHEMVIDEVGPGGFFGELSMLTGEPRSARVQALDAVTTLALDRTVFLTFLEAHPHTAMDVLTVLGRRLHRTNSLLQQTVSRNVNEVAQENLTLGQRMAEAITEMSGSIPFLLVHAVLFIGWILWNQPWFPSYHFDTRPHDMLALVVGLEATLLSLFVLSSQNRQDSRDRLARDIDHQVNTKAEIEIGLILRRLDDMERTLHHYYAEQCALIAKAPANGMTDPEASAAVLRSEIARMLDRLNDLERSIQQQHREQVALLRQRTQGGIS